MNDFRMNHTYIDIGSNEGKRNELESGEEEQLLFNQRMNELFGITVTLSPKEKTNGT